MTVFRVFAFSYKVENYQLLQTKACYSFNWDYHENRDEFGESGNQQFGSLSGIRYILRFLVSLK